MAWQLPIVPGFAVWFTGLPSSGKTALAQAFALLRKNGESFPSGAKMGTPINLIGPALILYGLFRAPAISALL